MCSTWTTCGASARRCAGTARRRGGGRTTRSCVTCPVICAETSASVRAQLNAVPQATKELMGPSPVGGTPQELVAYYQAFVDAGLQFFVAMSPLLATMRLLAQRVLPELVPAGPTAMVDEGQTQR